MAEQIVAEIKDTGHTVETARLSIAKHFADTVVREMSVAGQQTLDFYEGLDAFGDEDLQDKVKQAKKELDIIRSLDYHKALNNLYFDVYSQLSDKYVIKYAEEIDYENAVVQVGSLNGQRVQALVDDFMSGVYKAPTIQ